MAVNTGSFNKNVDDNNRSPEMRAKARNEAQIAALVEERAAYVARGDDKRAALVTESLNALGYREDKGTDTPDTTRAVQPVEKRTQ